MSKIYLPDVKTMYTVILNGGENCANCVLACNTVTGALCIFDILHFMAPPLQAVVAHKCIVVGN